MTVVERFINKLAGENEAPITFRARSCLRNRFWDSTCVSCVENCPQKAISFEHGLALIDYQACVACLVCVAVCPAEALVARDRRLDKAVSRFLGFNTPVSCCCEKNVRTGKELILPCLGVLSVEYLAAMAVVAGGVNLHLESCGDCRASFIPAILAQRVAELSSWELAGSAEKVNLGTTPASRPRPDFKIKLLARPSLSEGSLKGLIASLNEATPPSSNFAGDKTTSAADIPNRRSFFRAFRQLSWHAAAETWDNLRSEPEDFAQAQIPDRDKQAITRSTMLRQALSKAGPEGRRLLLPLFYSVEVNEGCNLCGACAGVCPTGALSNEWRDGSEKLWFNWAACSGCGLCHEFCPQKAISLTRGCPVENVDEVCVLLSRRDAQPPRGRRARQS